MFLILLGCAVVVIVAALIARKFEPDPDSKLLYNRICSATIPATLVLWFGFRLAQGVSGQWRNVPWLYLVVGFVLWLGVGIAAVWVQVQPLEQDRRDRLGCQVGDWLWNGLVKIKGPDNRPPFVYLVIAVVSLVLAVVQGLPSWGPDWEEVSAATTSYVGEAFGDVANATVVPRLERTWWWIILFVLSTIMVPITWVLTRRDDLRDEVRAIKDGLGWFKKPVLVQAATTANAGGSPAPAPAAPPVALPKEHESKLYWLWHMVLNILSDLSVGVLQH